MNLIEKHEATCLNRKVNCPFQHANIDGIHNIQLNIPLNELEDHIASRHQQNWTLDELEDHNWTLERQVRNARSMYVYFAGVKTWTEDHNGRAVRFAAHIHKDTVRDFWLFWVNVAEGEEEAARYKAELKLKDGLKESAVTQVDVVSIDVLNDNMLLAEADKIMVRIDKAVLGKYYNVNKDPCEHLKITSSLFQNGRLLVPIEINIRRD
jgi:hypothetical protein